MKRVVVIGFVIVAFGAVAAYAQQVPVARVAADAIVVDRVAEASQRDLPRDLLRRIVEEDIELLRGPRPDGTYEYATWERLEAGRTTRSASVQARKDRMETVEISGEHVYRALIEVPSRRLIFTRNRPVWIERVDVESVREGGTQPRQDSIDVKAWIQPGEVRPVDLPSVARQATVRVIATADPKAGYSNIEVALLHARIVDAATSPYAEAVTAAKALLKTLEDPRDVASIRASAQRLRNALPAAAEPATVAPRFDAATRIELQTELQIIAELLRGTESERRDAMDRLDRLIARLRR